MKKVELRDVDCSNQSALLQKVLEEDQRVRTTEVEFKEFVRVDHENVETVLSIIEKCGMPTVEEVESTGMNAIWFVLQHTPHSNYMKQYFPMIEKAVANGDLRKEQLALMQDRILMNDCKPQIYGSQIKKGKLYKLAEPEYVNERRAEMGMQPLEDYLKRFNIDFDVEQKNKE